jgi:hypothetical protein
MALGLTVTEDLYIYENSALSSLSFPELTDITSMMWLENNASLVNLDGFSSLSNVGQVYLVGEPTLDDISGLSGATIDYMYVEECPYITAAEVSSLPGVSSYNWSN